MTKLKKETIREILQKRFKDDCHTKLSLIPAPFLFKDMQKAALRIKEAIEKKEKIVIVGDYDVDGVVSLVVLAEFFDDFGIDYDIEIPNRFSDGYGLNPSIVERIRADVVITVDNGISAVAAAELCLQNGIDLIITDHHTPPHVLPNAYAVINPKQSECSFPNSEICGAQIAWYLAAAIKDVCKYEYDLTKFLDILSIAIMADMMDLKDINRTMVKRGLKLLNNSTRPAFMAIREIFKKEHFDSDDISFLISPLLNSSGRMEDALFSYGFLRSKSKKEALARLDEIIGINERRKEEERALFEDSLKFADENDAVVVVWGEAWHEGVIGIVASRLAKKFKKPSIVFSLKGDNAKGSARSVAGVDILSLIAKQSELLLGFGGHFGAAGVLLLQENLELFKKRINENAKELRLHEVVLHDESLGEIEPEAIDFELLEILEEFEPYGQKNPKPTFIMRGAKVKIDKLIGREGRHKKFILQSGEKTIEALYYNFKQEIKSGDMIDILFSVSRNDFRGLVTPQLLIREILHHIPHTFETAK
ncbi:MAG: single-stranded-DNA-specific exonuclease RecJ [Campylobacteraceae bacterium]|jgi:single-stranded-DNA-specific exonuclease|nr:single-stranded-DNA-specific exonuclease RecJ [Campylobacteraceae bacterium]